MTEPLFPDKMTVSSVTSSPLNNIRTVLTESSQTWRTEGSVDRPKREDSSHSILHTVQYNNIVQYRMDIIK